MNFPFLRKKSAKETEEITNSADLASFVTSGGPVSNARTATNTSSRSI